MVATRDQSVTVAAAVTAAMALVVTPVALAVARVAMGPTDRAAPMEVTAVLVALVVRFPVTVAMAAMQAVVAAVDQVAQEQRVPMELLH